MVKIFVQCQPETLRETLERLREQGFVLEKELVTPGLVTGSIEEDKMDTLRATPGVEETWGDFQMQPMAGQ